MPHWFSNAAPRMQGQLVGLLRAKYTRLSGWPIWIRPIMTLLFNHLRTFPVIVQLKRPATQPQMEAFVRDVEGRVRVSHYLPSIHAFAADVSAHAIKNMVESDVVVRVYHDGDALAMMDVASTTIGAPVVHESGVTGQGVTVAILDTGIHAHPDLVTPHNRIKSSVDLVRERPKTYDDHGHGTHIAGLIAGNGTLSHGAHKGVAPDADLVSVKVLNKHGIGKMSTVIAGLEWCMANRDAHGIGVLCLPLGVQAGFDDVPDPLSQAAETAIRRGLVVVAAAGNHGPHHGSVTAPARSPSVICVGASDDRNTVPSSYTQGAKIAPFSGRGDSPGGAGMVGALGAVGETEHGGTSKPDLVAPGVSVVSLSTGRRRPRRKHVGAHGDWYQPMSGTSVSTGLAAGTVALLLSKHPALTPDEVRQALLHYAASGNETPATQGRGQLYAKFIKDF